MVNKELDVALNKATETQLKDKPDPDKLGFGVHFTDHMFVMHWNREQGWHNAEICAYRNFSLDPAAMVFHYGQEIFEGLKAYRGADDQVYLFFRNGRLLCTLTESENKMRPLSCPLLTLTKNPCIGGMYCDPVPPTP